MAKGKDSAGGLQAWTDMRGEEEHMDGLRKRKEAVSCWCTAAAMNMSLVGALGGLGQG